VVGCALTPSDGLSAGPPVTATATVANSAPTLAGALLAPHDPDRTSVLTCEPIDAADADGDALTLSWAWFVDGVQVSQAPALTGGLHRGAVVTCRLTASDGLASSPAVTASVTVGDAAPSVTSGLLAPSPLRTDDTATVSVSTSDPDGDAVALRYAWTVNGASVGADAPSLAGSAFVKGDLVAVTVTPSDGEREGAPWVVGPVTVVDTPPTAPVVQIGPEGARPRTPLVCALVTPSIDADGDAVSYAWSWSSTGGALTPTSGAFPGDTVPGVQVLGGTYTCAVTPSAGGATGEAGVDTLVVEPLFPSATIQLADTSVQVFGGVASENLGRGPCTVAALDVDGDGLDDVAVGAPDANTPLADSGAVWIFLADQLVAGTDRSTATAHASILGDQFSGQLGRCVLNAGDLDGDGGDELLIGAPNRDGGLTDNGAVLLFASSDLLAGGALGPADALRAWTGPAANDLAGFSLGRADVDGQGVADLLVGAPQLATSVTGRVYALRGEALPASGSLGASAFGVFETSETRARFGESLAGVPDLDGDGRDELAVGAPLSDEGVNDGGAIYVLPGASLPASPARANVASSLLRLRGVSTADNAGTRLVAGDLDGDGLSELVVGAPYRNLTGVDDGVVYVVQGTVVSGGGALTLGSAWLRVDGATAGDLTGAGLALVPDLSYDGLPELLVGAQGRDTQGLEAGEAMLWTSQQVALGGVSSATSADYRFLGEDRNDLAGQVAGAGDVDGDGRGDLFVLAPGEGSQVGSGGRLYVVLAP
jgi:hypothetical protein